MTQRERQILQCIEAEPMISQQELADRLGITRSSVGVHIANLTHKGYIAGRGYVLAGGSYVVVVGGVNVDIGGRSFGPLVSGDSNPGLVSTSLGGVGRNIAHNMSLLGLNVNMLTAYGDDVNGHRIAESCAELNIDISHAQVVPGGATPTYLYITGPDGDMSLAVSDMEICSRISPAYLAANLTLLNRAQLVVVDANIPQESLVYLAENCTAPIFCDPVSTIKAEKLRLILDRIHTLKPNRLEAELLSGMPIHSHEDAFRAGHALLEKGTERVFISLGSDGLVAVTHEEELWLPNVPGAMVNTTGCGDALMAGLAWAWMEEADLKTTLLAGLSAASIAMESRETINRAMSATALQARIESADHLN